jgi:polyvinyl alcohol dehydrogenase (cytochrome)
LISSKKIHMGILQVSRGIVMAVAAWLFVAAGNAARAQDWPMYNADVRGTRHNPAETTIGRDNAQRLAETWRFPPVGSDQRIGVIHATPAVVDGCVYFGTASDAAFYKLSPDGELLWSYRNIELESAAARLLAVFNPESRFRSVAEGIVGSALVQNDTVFFADVAGWIYALDSQTGAERWKLNTRSKSFPGAHPYNSLFASPIPADGKVIFAGGALEQLFAGSAFYKGSTGRGFVVALDPQSGNIAWKYDLGPKPQPHNPPLRISDSWGDHFFEAGPATSTIWSTPSFDEDTGTLFFGTDVNTAPRKPTEDNPRLDTPESCAVVALDVRNGHVKWIRQLNPGDVWTNAMRAFDPATGRYKDQSIGDTPKIYSLPIDGKLTKVVGVGCKNGAFYVLRSDTGRVVDQTPTYTGQPTYPLSPAPDPRMLALPSPIGGLQTGCATDGKSIFSNGIDALQLGTQESMFKSGVPPTGGRVVAISLDTREERWRHERPKVASLGGPAPKVVYTNVGDPVASGIAVANGVVYCTAVASGKFIALDASTGSVLKEIDVEPVWSGPSVSRGHIYVGTGNTLFSDADYEAFLPKRYTGVLYCFGLSAENSAAAE